MMQQIETRIGPRKILRCRAKVLANADTVLDGRIVDISPSGLGVIVERPLPAGHTCTIVFATLVLGMIKQVSVTAKVIYSICKGMEGFRTGFQFNQLSPEMNAVINGIISS